MESCINNVHTHSSFKCFYTNADSFVNKFDEFEARVSQLKPLLIAITEVKPKHSRYSIDINEVMLKDYDMYTNIGLEGRGICIYVHNCLSTKESDINVNTSVESVWIEIRLKDNNVLLAGCIYRSPNSPPANNQDVCDLMRKVGSHQASHILIMGDFNYPEVNWEENQCHVATQRNAYDFLESIRDAFLYQHVKNPTRYRIDQEPHILDLIFTNEEGMIDDLEIEPPLGKSDHSVLTFTFIVETVTEPSKTTKYMLNKGDYNKLRDQMRTDWTTLLENKSANECWEIIANKIHKASKECIPIRKYSNDIDKKQDPLWIDCKTRMKIKEKHKSWRKYMNCKTRQNYVQYTRARNQARWATREARKNIEKSIAQNVKENPKAFWRYAKSQTKTKTNVSDLQYDDGSSTHTDLEKAEVLNMCFSKIFTIENQEQMPQLRNKANVIPTTQVKFTTDNIQNKLKALKAGKSPGPDGIHPRVLKELHAELAEPLHELMQTSLDTGKLPNDWKVGHVTPIFKKGDKHDPKNYRPVSLTAVVCKIMESFIRDAVIQHMITNKLLAEEQHGFIEGRSCITQLLEVLDQWTDTIDKGGRLDAIYLDFMKAFDTVPHQRLLHKLKGYGIRGKLLSWIREFLSGRKQRVMVNGSMSTWCKVTSGIPQGSVLGPVLFVVFINDLPEVVKSGVALFADDTKIFRQIESEQDCELLQQDLDALQTWSDEWQLKFHPDKCKNLRVGKDHPNNDYYMVNMDTGIRQPLQVTHLEKDLGVYTDDQLRFSDHIQKTVVKANRVLGIIRRSYKYLDKDSLLLLYKGLVRPILEYGENVWSPHLLGDISIIEAVQRRATRLIPNFKDMSYEQRLKQLNLPTLVYRRLRGDMIQVYKYLHNKNTVDTKMFKKAEYTSTRGHSLKLFKERNSLNIRQHFFSQRIVEWWNSLSEEVLTAPSVDTFKARLDNAWSKIPFCYDYTTYRPSTPHFTAIITRTLKNSV